MQIFKDKSLSAETAELRRKAEERLLATRSESRHPRTEEEMQRLIHELEVHQIELEMQNTVLLQTRDDLEKALDKYTNLYDFAPVGYFTLDHEGIVLAANLGGAGLLGMERSMLIGRRFGLLVAIEDRPAFADFLGKIFAGEGRESCEVTLLGKGNHPLFTQIEAVSFASGLECHVAVIDISDRKRAEEASRESENRCRTLFNSIDEGFCIIEMIFDEHENPIDYLILETNPSFEKQTGLIAAQGKRMRQIAPKHEEHWFETYGKVALTGESARFQNHADQLQRWYDVYAFRFGQPENRRVAVLFNDITVRKGTQEEKEKLLAQLEAVLNSINEGVVITDLSGNILTMNPSALAFHEYESVEQVRQQLHQLLDTFEVFDLDGKSVPFVDWPLSRVLRGERIADVELRVYRKDTGTSRIGSYSGRPVQNRSGNEILAVITVHDISERKRAEAEIRRLASFPLMNPNPVLELGADGHMTFCNPAAKQILEKGGYVTDINPLIPQDLPVIFQDLRDKKANQFFREIEINGNYFEELIYVTPLFESVRIYTMDITRRKLAEEKIEILNKDLAARAVELEDANRELEAFNYTVAHDLRNPLNVVSSYCQVIKELCSDKLDEQCRGYLQETYNGTLRMNRLIEALLQFSRLAHVELKRDRVDLSSVAREVAAELQLSDPERRVESRIANGIVADGDAALLRIVLTNLLGNAWKYTATREEAIIEFAVTKIDERPVLFVRDNGNGFDMTYADKLFVPFQRLPGAEECRGFGIGLATVERIIRRHGGRVWAEGESGKGATFYFTLQT